MSDDKVHKHTFSCCGVTISAQPLRVTIQQLDAAAKARLGQGVHLCNAYTLSLAGRDNQYREALNRGTCLPDGSPVAFVGRRAGFAELTGPVRGPSLMLALMGSGVSWGAKHYLYGSDPTTLSALCKRLSARWPGLNLVGEEAPPFRHTTTAEEADTVLRVADSGAHYLWVGLGTPKQDLFIARNQPSLTTVTLGVGAAFDFHAGNVREAPTYLHGSGLEWAHRLAQDPRRLWRRYLVGNLSFVTQGLLPTLWQPQQRG